MSRILPGTVCALLAFAVWRRGRPVGCAGVCGSLPLTMGPQKNGKHGTEFSFDRNVSVIEQPGLYPELIKSRE